jgi:hydroxypyruvate isomerase
VGSANVKVLYDIYHQQIMEGNIISTIVKNIDKIGHFHAPGNPGRNELYIGELNYSQIFHAIDGTHFSGYIGLEYFPLEDPKKGLIDLLHNE